MQKGIFAQRRQSNMTSRLVRLNRSIPVVILLVATAGVLSAQDASQASPQQGAGPYQGVSKPPADDVIITTSIPAAKPPAGQPMNAQPSAQSAPTPGYGDPANASAPQSANGQNSQGEPQPTSVDPSVNFPAPEAADGTDGGVVRVAPSSPPADPSLNQRMYPADPDGDIVHVRSLRPGELQEGTSIQVHLLDRLSTSMTEKGEPFRSSVAYDVMQGGQVLIPAGSEIDGTVVEVSTGHAGGHGTMRLEPQSVTLPNGTHFTIHAEVTGTHGSHTRVGDEGTIRPDSRVKRDSIEYGGAVGSGVVVGAVVGGPVGALTGGLIGAGAVTVHLLVNHPQATLETGTLLVFQLTDPLYLAPAGQPGN
jgi:hypothetical protein